jgi:hypothetical protein
LFVFFFVFLFLLVILPVDLFFWWFCFCFCFFFYFLLKSTFSVLHGVIKNSWQRVTWLIKDLKWWTCRTCSVFL